MPPSPTPGPAGEPRAGDASDPAGSTTPDASPPPSETQPSSDAPSPPSETQPPSDAPSPPSDPRPASIVAILAGGRSRRMGIPKAGVLLDGRPLLAHAADAARAAGLRPVVVAKRTSVLPDVAGLERWDEPDEPVHPLTGVAAALRRADAPIVVLPVDLPRVPGALLAHLAARPEPVVVVEAAGRVHPLLARFTPACAGALAAAAAAGSPVVATVRALGAAICGDAVVRPLGDPARSLANVNRPSDVRDAGTPER
ncbi:NTP transferase domain-containing protein [Patulibacter sp. NPDC049589]|uniref:molybdenum cofactor guanylyltransferase n=1 Tax=Patulibacter sp. NPDC049589 TaxID=3154731 RepID=UPI00341FE89A